jgi:phospholipid transport system substrate-binding protein
LGKEATMGRHSIRLCVLLMILIVPVSTRAESLLQVIETRVDRILDVLRNPGEAKATKEKKIWPIIDKVFDYRELSKFSLASFWRTFSPEQQREFVTLFRKVLGRAYMDKLLGYTNERVVFGKVIEISKERVEIRSKIVTQTRSIPIDYRMIVEKGQWKVYDLVIEEVSLVENYRNQFREILSNKSPEDLLKVLREKVRQ